MRECRYRRGCKSSSKGRQEGGVDGGRLRVLRYHRRPPISNRRDTKIHALEFCDQQFTNYCGFPKSCPFLRKKFHCEHIFNGISNLVFAPEGINKSGQTRYQ